MLTASRRVLYAWENPGVPVDEVVNDILRAFHHPAIRDERAEIQRNMFNTVRQWLDEHPRRQEMGHLLSSESVKTGKNHLVQGHKTRGQGGHSHGLDDPGHGKVAGGLWGQIRTRDLSAMEGGDGNPQSNYMSASPMNSPGFPPPTQNYGYGQSAGYLQPQPGSYNAPVGQGYAPPGAQESYWGPPQPPQPPQAYGGTGYGGQPPQNPPYGQYPPYP